MISKSKIREYYFERVLVFLNTIFMNTQYKFQITFAFTFKIKKIKQFKRQIKRKASEDGIDIIGLFAV